LGCGIRDRQEHLIRLACIAQDQLVVDQARGRGGYLHRKQDCWRAFLGRRSHYRAFRAEVSRVAKEKLIRELQDQNWE